MDDKIAYYNTIIEELEKCNCKEDFEKLIEGNDFLRENRKYFEWLLDESKNNVLKVYNTLLCNRIMPYYSWVLKAEFNQENFKRNFFNMINKSKKDFKGYWIVFAKIIEDGIIRHQLFENVLSQIKGNIISINPLIGIVKGKYNPFFVNEFELLVCALDSSLIGKLEEKIKSEDFIKKEVIKIVGENNIEVYLNHIAEIFKDYASILAQYNLPMIMGLRNMGEDNDYINNSLFYRIFVYLCEFEYRYKALKNQFDLAIVSIMNDLGKRNKVLADSNKVLEKEIEKSNEELKKEIEKKKSQKQIIGEVEEVYKQNLDKFSGVNVRYFFLFFCGILGYLLTFNDWFKEWFLGSNLTNTSVVKWSDSFKSVMAGISFLILIFLFYISIHRNRFFKFFIIGIDINYLALGLSIVGSFLTFTDKFRKLIGIKDTLEFNSVKDVIIIIMLKIPFAIVGFLAYRNIQRNRFLKEEYQHKNTVMKIFNQFREDSDDEVRDKSKQIMLEMFKENPNDKLIKKDKYNFKFLNKLINNVTELRKAFKEDEKGKEDKK
jgi:hypothetical protein